MNLRSVTTSALSCFCLLSQIACGGGGTGGGTGGTDGETGGGPGSGGDGAGGSETGSGGDEATGGLGGEGPQGSGGQATGGGSGIDIPPGTCGGPQASLNANGTLTPYPNIAVTLTPAEDYSLVSFNLMSVEDGDTRGPLLRFYAELKNESLTEKCYFLPEVYLGFTEVVTLADGDQFYQDLGSFISTVTKECIQPGQTGILYGVQRGITEGDLAAAATLEIAPAPTNYETDIYLPAPEPTVTGAEIKETEGLYSLAGSVSYSETIYNQGITVYPRDDRGLIFADLIAFPGNLGTHLAGTADVFETDGTPCPFVAYELTQSWILEE